MNEQERNEVSHSLRDKVSLVAMLFSCITCICISAIALLLFGPMELGGSSYQWVGHLFISAFVLPLCIPIFVLSNIWTRQLSLPAALIVIVYALLEIRGSAFYVVIYLAIIAVIIRIIIGLIEAHVATGRYTDFWRSFVFNPLDWGHYFGIRTIWDDDGPPQVHS